MGRRLDDDPLAEEIELYGELLVAAAEEPDDGPPLSQDRIDRALGLLAERRSVDRHPPRARHPKRPET